MIGSAAGYSFFDFILYDAPAVAIILVAILGVFYALYGRKMNVDDEHKARIMELDEHAQIKNRRLLKQSVVMTAWWWSGSWRMARWGWNRALSR